MYKRQVFFKVFDAQVQPIVLYGAEIWGVDNSSYVIEKLHLLAMKKMLGVGMRTPNDLINGELGRFPIYNNAQIRCVRYLLKLTQMSEQRLPFILCNLDERGQTNWVSNVRCLLSSYGFRYIWDSQGVGHIDEFLKVFRQSY